ncbi:lipopolysaccharide biosynthesis protein [Nocardioides sp. YIM 152315]|uniref:lipopolysaccharide biosynthesis protein n=1 Tax=Nocardioides sp. YIM 152315 TaxID=3031760 RepID=UPI0023DB213D|nr:lipopolysaccharide biosynthesis protein [Nocardioides sp. YIM 152315]MDF1603453.1 lipopolysaccharide biosynthesis protein [Nocardioides sp. YIM 152315]
MSEPKTSAGVGTTEDVTTASVARATRHTALSQGFTQAVRFATTIVLARLLTPDDFGVVAIAMVVSMLIDQLKDVGTGSAIVQKDMVDDALINAVFYLNLVLGTLLAATMYLTAGPVASLLGNQDAEPVLQAFAAITFLTSFAQIHHALLRRQLRFFELAVVTTTTAAVTAAVSIAAAVLGLDYWALVAGTAAGAVVGTVMVWHYDRWRPTWGRVELSSLQSIWRFSYHLFLSNLLFLVFNQVDKVIVSRFLGGGALGTYTLAQRTVTSPIATVGSVVAEVTFPAFSRRQDDDAALRAGYVKSSRVVALVTFPAMCGLAALATPAVAVVFGPDWNDLVPIIWLLAPVAAIQSVTASSGQILLAKGRSDISYRWGIVYCVVLTVGELCAVPWGLPGVAAAFAAGVLLLMPFGLMLAFREIDLRLRDYAREMLPYVWITLVMTAIAFGASQGVRAVGGSQLLELAVGTLAGGLAYVLLLRRVRPQGLLDAMSALRERPSA